MAHYASIILMLAGTYFISEISPQTTSRPDNNGREFIFGFLEPYSTNAVEEMLFGSAVPRQLFVPTNVSIHVHDGSYNAARQLLTYSAVANFTARSSTIADFDPNRVIHKGVIITSTSDIFLYGISLERSTTDGFLALPTDILTGNYIIMSPATSITFQEIEVIGVVNNTNVSILSPSNSVVAAFTLNRGDSYEYTSSEDVSGYTVHADYKVAVMSGSKCTDIPSGYSACDHVVEMLPPIESLGQNFIFAPLRENCAVGYTCRSFFKITAAYDNTSVIRYGSDITETYTLNAGHSMNIQPISTVISFVRSTKPILAGVFAAGKGYTHATGDPFFSLIPQIEAYGSEYNAITCLPHYDSTSQYFNIEIETAKINGLMIGNRRAFQLPTFQCDPVPSTNYSACTFQVPCNSLNYTTPMFLELIHINPQTTFSLLAYGYTSYDSYGYIGGMRLPSSQIECHNTTDEYPPDGVDNDCDGRIDEELRNFIDDDGDGLIDEDLATSIPVITSQNMNQQICTFSASYTNPPNLGGYSTSISYRCTSNINLTFTDEILNMQTCSYYIKRSLNLIDGCGNIAIPVYQNLHLTESFNQTHDLYHFPQDGNFSNWNDAIPFMSDYNSGPTITTRSCPGKNEAVNITTSVQYLTTESTGTYKKTWHVAFCDGSQTSGMQTITIINGPTFNRIANLSGCVNTPLSFTAAAYNFPTGRHVRYFCQVPGFDHILATLDDNSILSCTLPIQSSPTTISVQAGFKFGDYTVLSNGNGSVVYNGCPHTCSGGSSCYACQCVSLKTCRAVTDPHFTTFDGKFYSPQETPNQRYLAAAPVTRIANTTIDWSVNFYTQHWHNSPHYTCINAVEIVLDDQVVTMGMNGQLLVNSVATVAPWYYPNKGIHTASVVPFGTSGHSLATNDLLKVTFTGDSSYTMTIQVPKEIYSAQLQGACGNLDGSSSDDGQCPTPCTTIDQCWKSPKTTAQPSNGYVSMTTPVSCATSSPTLIPDPCATEEVNANVLRQCAVISDPTGPFRACVINATSIENDFYNSCTVDLCAVQGEDARCNLLQAYATACMTHLPGTLIDWRSPTLCPPDCPANMHYEACANACPKTCGDPEGPETSCSRNCHGSCTCNPGYLLQNGVCVNSAQCGCTDDKGNYHMNGDNWVESDCSRECQCTGQVVRCSILKPCDVHASCSVKKGQRNCYCDSGYIGNGFSCAYEVIKKTCHAVTDPHFETFDGAFYSPQQVPNHRYIAAALITKPVNTTFSWSVNFITQPWYNSPRYTCINTVEIELDDQVITMGMHGRLLINGLITVAPWYYPNKTSNTASVVSFGVNGHLLRTTDLLRVTFTGDSSNSMTIEVPFEMYQTKLEGVCGNMDGYPSNDGHCPTPCTSIDQCWKWPRNTTQPSLTTGSGTTTGIICPTTSATPPPNPCASDEAHANALHQCGIISDRNGPFSACVINATTIENNFYQSCMIDLCAVQGGDARCNLLQAYATACMAQLPGILIDWRSPTLCPASCPSNMHYEACANACPKTCGDPNGPVTCSQTCHGSCTCDAGYFLQNGVCVNSTLCGCTDSLGNYHINEDHWVNTDCTLQCSCSGQSIQCTNMQPCDFHASCVIKNGHRNCSCNSGFTGTGYQCTTISANPTTAFGTTRERGSRSNGRWNWSNGRRNQNRDESRQRYEGRNNRGRRYEPFPKANEFTKNFYKRHYEDTEEREKRNQQEEAEKVTPKKDVSVKASYTKNEVYERNRKVLQDAEEAAESDDEEGIWIKVKKNGKVPQEYIPQESNTNSHARQGGGSSYKNKLEELNENVASGSGTGRYTAGRGRKIHNGGRPQDSYDREERGKPYKRGRRY